SAQAPAGMPQSAQTATGIPQSAQVASAQQSAMQASPARPTPPPPSSRQPLPPVNTAAAPMPPQQQHARGAGAAAPRDGESAYGGAPRDERPPLPQRNAQEHLVPELRNSPAPRRSADEEVEHDPGLMATFRRGFSLADHESDEPPTNSSR
ncbi:ATP-binding protein, partial [Streptomyces sp. NPDC050619]